MSCSPRSPVRSRTRLCRKARIQVLPDFGYDATQIMPDVSGTPTFPIGLPTERIATLGCRPVAPFEPHPVALRQHMSEKRRLNREIRPYPDEAARGEFTPSCRVLRIPRLRDVESCLRSNHRCVEPC